MDFPQKKTPLDAPIAPLIAKRWSPYAFSPSSLSQEQITSVFEAARFAPSAFNEQPWRYIYAQKNDKGREELESLLMEGNSWAKNAGMLIIGFAKKTFTRNQKLNRHAMHDTGAASALLVLQATELGLVSHQMSGFHAEKANELLGMSEDFEPSSMIAIGHAGRHEELPEELQQRENAPRTRHPQADFVFLGRFNS